jgi:hypothetical protein
MAWSGATVKRSRRAVTRGLVVSSIAAKYTLVAPRRDTGLAWVMSASKPAGALARLT